VSGPASDRLAFSQTSPLEGGGGGRRAWFGSAPALFYRRGGGGGRGKMNPFFPEMVEENNKEGGGGKGGAEFALQTPSYFRQPEGEERRGEVPWPPAQYQDLICSEKGGGLQAPSI